MSAFLHSEVSIRFMYLRDAKKIYTTSGIAYETPASVGLDLRACIEETSLTILPGERETIPCGIAIEPLEKNLAGFVYSRSGLGAIHGLTVAQGVGVIDPDYRGEIIVVLLNTAKNPVHVNRGDRIAQLVFQPAFQVSLVEAQQLDDTSRGSFGFGHTGKN